MKNNPNGRYVDEAYPFIWKDLHEKGFITLHLEDWPHIGAFNYRLKGFSNYTCHHYFQHYQFKLLNNMAKLYFRKKKIDDFCVGAKKRHKVLLDLILNFKREYKQLTNNLAIMHFVENSHNTNERFNWVDDDLYRLLKSGNDEGLFENTALFLYSDHGPRFVDKRSSNNRYLEERLPFFAIHLPEKYKKNNPDKYNNFKINSKLLTTPFDIYSTVRDLTCLDQKNNILKGSNRLKRSISLMTKISPKRTCEHIGISDHYCTCVQNWVYLDINSTNVFEAVNFIIKSINQITDIAKDLCLKLSLEQIISAEYLIKNFKRIFKIQFITSPNKGVYEAVVYDQLIKEFEFISNKLSIKSRNEISRINSYGEQPFCIEDFENPANILDLRKFCFCKSIKGVTKQ